MQIVTGAWIGDTLLDPDFLYVALDPAAHGRNGRRLA